MAAWAKKLVDQRAWVMHLPTRTVGRVSKFIDGTGEAYVLPREETPLGEPLLETEQGGVFIADASTFVQLREQEATYFHALQQAVAALVAEAGRRGVAENINSSTGRLLLAAALREPFGLTFAE